MYKELLTNVYVTLVKMQKLSQSPHITTKYHTIIVFTRTTIEPSEKKSLTVTSIFDSKTFPDIHLNLPRKVKNPSLCILFNWQQTTHGSGKKGTDSNREPRVLICVCGSYVATAAITIESNNSIYLEANRTEWLHNPNIYPFSHQ